MSLPSEDPLPDDPELAFRQGIGQLRLAEKLLYRAESNLLVGLSTLLFDRQGADAHFDAIKTVASKARDRTTTLRENMEALARSLDIKP